MDTGSTLDVMKRCTVRTAGAGNCGLHAVAQTFNLNPVAQRAEGFTQLEAGDLRSALALACGMAAYAARPPAAALWTRGNHRVTRSTGANVSAAATRPANWSSYPSFIAENGEWLTGFDMAVIAGLEPLKKLRLIIFDPRLTKLALVLPLQPGAKVPSTRPLEITDVEEADIVIVLCPGLHWEATSHVDDDGNCIKRTRFGPR